MVYQLFWYIPFMILFSNCNNDRTCLRIPVLLRARLTCTGPQQAMNESDKECVET